VPYARRHGGAAALFKAVADPVRLRLLSLIADNGFLLAGSGDGRLP
jgi:hypothetical protein